MGQQPAHDIMTFPEMLEAEKARAETRLYSKTEDVQAKIQAMIGQTVLDIVNLPQKISLNDTETVRTVTKNYLLASYSNATIPSKAALCRGFGVSIRAVDDFMSRNPDHETSQFLRLVFDSFADLLANSALVGGTNMVMSIFLLKSIFGFKEGITIETTVRDPLGEPVSAEEIARKYSELPPE